MGEQSARMKDRSSLRILCFGDSLTSGYFGYGFGEHPYSEALEDRLAMALAPWSTELHVVTNGLPGDRVSGDVFLSRLEDELSKGDTFDWVIILGGTNDIGLGVPPDLIVSSLKAIWLKALDAGSRVLALTVPERLHKSESLDNRRDKVNQEILSYKHENFYTLDLKAKIPYHSLTDAQRALYWDDGLHLTSEGYDWMGNHIADTFLSLYLQTTSPKKEPPPPAPEKQRRKKPVRSRKEWDDVGPFEEEEGDPKRLSRGYVVVRNSDLD